MRFFYTFAATFNIYNMSSSLIGRKEEQAMLERLFNSKKSEFVAIYGRRRVGKTFLVTETFQERLTFKHTGLSPYDKTSPITMKDQLLAFHYSLILFGEDTDLACPKSWMEAFFRLKTLLAKKTSQKKQVVFIDELPWMDTPKSKFLSAFENFYNGWAADKNILLVICGSSSSWILDNIIENRGGLYNRLTCQIKLSPFCLKEVESFFQHNNIHLGRYDIVRAYMTLGGIPYYLSYFVQGKSVEQNIDDILFREQAPLKNEFRRLFKTLFTHEEKYMDIVRVLARRNYGFTRSEIAQKTGIPYGGGLSSMLKMLSEADFVEEYVRVFGSAKQPLYRLKDSFCLFYLKFLDGSNKRDEHFWQNSARQKGIRAWEGVAFERVCQSHIRFIKDALGISGVATQSSNYIVSGDEMMRGAQVDLLIDRADNNINLCEMKFYAGEFTLDKDGELSLRNKISSIREKIGTKKNIFPTLITTFGLKNNAYSGIFQNVLTLDDLF